MSAKKAIVQIIGLTVALLGALCYPPLVMGASTGFHLTPNALHVTESFRGAPITISGEIPRGTQAVVEITGPAHDVHLLRKGRRGGLWMSVGEVEVSGAPSVYLVASTGPNLPTGSGSAGEWGYVALAKRVTFSGRVPPAEKPALFSEFAKLKESQGLYGVFPGALHTTPAAEGRSRLEGQLMLPGNLAPGKYEVTLSVFYKGELLNQQSLPLRVDMRGVTAFLAVLANRHGVLYGVLAVVIAVVAGFIMGFLFKGKGAH
jgi:hypothetical protein